MSAEHLVLRLLESWKIYQDILVSEQGEEKGQLDSQFYLREVIVPAAQVTIFLTSVWLAQRTGVTIDMIGALVNLGKKSKSFDVRVKF